MYLPYITFSASEYGANAHTISTIFFKNRLKSRHVQFIAIGGMIGTALRPLVPPVRGGKGRTNAYGRAD